MDGIFLYKLLSGGAQVIPETSAMYNPSNPTGSSDFDIKQNWWQQVFNVQGDSAQV